MSEKIEDAGRRAQDSAGPPSRVRSSGSIRIPLPPEQAFHLFTAEGEASWVPGWVPTILGSGLQSPGLVFLTSAGANQTVWTVITSDPSTNSHRYCRVTPQLHAGLVDVRLEQEAGGSRVLVGYDMTALPGAPLGCLDQYKGAAFQHMLESWARHIATSLKRSEKAD